MHKNPGRPTLKIGWSTYQKAIDELAEGIEELKDKKGIKCITGIPKGGVIPAIHLSNLTELEYIDYWSIFPTHRKGNILVVDDISDTGDTLLSALGRLRAITRYELEVFSACLYARTTTKTSPTLYYQCIVDEWLQFPWEKTT